MVALMRSAAKSVIVVVRRYPRADSPSPSRGHRADTHRYSASLEVIFGAEVIKERVTKEMAHHVMRRGLS